MCTHMDENPWITGYKVAMRKLNYNAIKKNTDNKFGLQKFMNTEEKRKRVKTLLQEKKKERNNKINS